MKKKRKVYDADDDTDRRSPKYRRPDISRRNETKKYYDNFVIKCTLNRLTRFAIITDEIRDCVYWISKLMYHTHAVMNLYLLRSRGILPPGIANKKTLVKFWAKLTRVVARVLRKKKAEKRTDKVLYNLCVEYCEQTGVERNWPQDCTTGWRGRVLEEMAKASGTNHKTHLDTNLFIYTMRYMKYLVQTDERYSSIRELTKKERDMVFAAISYALGPKRERIQEIIRRRPKTLERIPATDEIWELAQELCDRVVHFVPVKANVVKKSQLCYDLLVPLAAYGKRLQTLFESGQQVVSNVGGRKGRQKWSFSLCPHMDYRPKYIHINSTALNELFLQMAKKYPHIKALHEGISTAVYDGDENDEWTKKFKLWNSLFKMNRVMRKKKLRDSSAMHFAGFIQTDGVGVSCVFERRKCEKECRLVDVNRWIKCMEKDLEESSGRSLELASALLVLRQEKKDIENELECRGPRINDAVRNMAGLEAYEDGSVGSKATIIGLDPGKKSAATFVRHSRAAQLELLSCRNRGSAASGCRYETGSITANEWIYISGQKLFTKKVKKRLSVNCPEWNCVPSVKTAEVDEFLYAYAYRNSLVERLEAAFFTNLWHPKQKMRKWVKRQQALETAVAKVCGTKDHREQKKTIVAFGDGDMSTNTRGLAPIMSTAFAKKMKQNTTVVFINEYKTSELCCCCHETLKNVKGNFRVKRCCTSDCTRGTSKERFWHRDVNAAINILLLFLEECLSGQRNPKFKRRKGTDE
jgi:hypothetical protein